MMQFHSPISFSTKENHRAETDEPLESPHYGKGIESRLFLVAASGFPFFIIDTNSS